MNKLTHPEIDAMAEQKEVKYKFPKTLGACLARLAELQDKADEIQARLHPIAKEETALREHMLEAFKKDELQGAKGSGRSISIVKAIVPTIVDWAAFWKFASRKGNDDLVQRSCKVDAWRQRVEAKQQVPGVEPFTRVSLRVERTKEK